MTQLRYAVRQLWSRPGAAVLVIAMLALGIGATTAIFSLFHEVLVAPLPVPHAEQLVALTSPGPKGGSVRVGTAVANPAAAFSYPMFRDLRSRQSVFTAVAAHLDFQANLAFRGRTLAGRGTFVSGSYFGVLELKPAAGRLIDTRDEPRVGESAVAVLSYDYWQSQFGGERNIVGQTLTVNGRPLVIVGVAPQGFTGAMLGYKPEVFVPVTLRWLLQPEAPADADDRRSYWLYLFARLKPGVTRARASAGINTLYSGILRDVEAPLRSDLSDDLMKRFLDRRIVLEPGARGQSVLRGPAAQPLTLLLGVTAVVLLIVCVNIANLLLARDASRAGEMAIRTSIGASRRQLAAQLLSESAVLAVAGGVLAIPVAAGTLRLIGSMIPARFTDGLNFGLSPSPIAFAAGASLATLLLFGLMPAWRASDANPSGVMNGQAAQTLGSRGVTRLRAALTTTQIAVSLMLLVLAGLFALSLAHVARVDLGIKAGSLVTFGIAPGLNGYDTERRAAFYDRLEDELGAQPGVTSVGSAMVPLMSYRAFNFSMSIEGRQSDAGANVSAGGNFVSPGFLDTLGIPLLAGRKLTAADRRGAPPVAVVNEAFVRKFGLSANAIGTHIGVGRRSEPSIEIVGVIADSKYSQVKAASPAQFFQPIAQSGGSPWMTFYVRGTVDEASLMGMIPRVVSSLDPNLPVSNLVTMESQIRSNEFLDRLIALLSASFAGLATLLAATGVYGVLAYNVAQRTRELGLRVALGAEPADLRTLALKQVGLMTLTGGALGLAAAVALGRAARALLYGLSGHEPSVLIAATGLLTAIVLGAAFVPAWRASRVSPMEALRYE